MRTRRHAVAAVAAENFVLIRPSIGLANSRPDEVYTKER
jgi:hypothetical protein